MKFDKIFADVNTILKQNYVVPWLESSLQTLYGRHHPVLDRYELSISRMPMYFSLLRRFICWGPRQGRAAIILKVRQWCSEDIIERLTEFLEIFTSTKSMSTNSLGVKKKPQILPKSSLKLISSKYSNFLLTTYTCIYNCCVWWTCCFYW